MGWGSRDFTIQTILRMGVFTLTSDWKTQVVRFAESQYQCHHNSLTAIYYKDISNQGYVEPYIYYTIYPCVKLGKILKNIGECADSLLLQQCDKGLVK